MRNISVLFSCSKLDTGKNCQKLLKNFGIWRRLKKQFNSHLLRLFKDTGAVKKLIYNIKGVLKVLLSFICCIYQPFNNNLSILSLATSVLDLQPQKRPFRMRIVGRGEGAMWQSTYCYCRTYFGNDLKTFTLAGNKCHYFFC